MPESFTFMFIVLTSENILGAGAEIASGAP